MYIKLILYITIYTQKLAQKCTSIKVYQRQQVTVYRYTIISLLHVSYMNCSSLHMHLVYVGEWVG